jgi:hypothetical protein
LLSGLSEASLFYDPRNGGWNNYNNNNYNNNGWSNGWNNNQGSVSVNNNNVNSNGEAQRLRGCFVPAQGGCMRLGACNPARVSSWL